MYLAQHSALAAFAPAFPDAEKISAFQIEPGNIDRPPLAVFGNLGAGFIIAGAAAVLGNDLQAFDATTQSAKGRNDPFFNPGIQGPGRGTIHGRVL